MSSNETATLGAARFAAYDGEYPDIYKRGYQESGRFGFDGDMDWTGHQRAEYRRGMADRYADNQVGVE